MTFYLPNLKRNGKNMRLECLIEGENARLRRYGIVSNSVSFASRYMPEDLVLIFRTLSILDKIADRSLANFIHIAVEGETDTRSAIWKTAVALNQLTYMAGGAVSASNYNSQIQEEIDGVFWFQLELDQAGKKKLFGRKRLWCSLRDYLKSPKFNQILVDALKEVSAPNPEKWERTNPDLKAALNTLELPGDVWNNAEIFRKGLFGPYIANERKTWDMPRTVRRIYEILGKPSDFYPEQLDVTFDFVPRMCERTMCSVCLFGGGVEDICHQTQGLLCPVTLYSCGYKHKCDPEDCVFKSERVQEFCVSYLRK